MPPWAVSESDDRQAQDEEKAQVTTTTRRRLGEGAMRPTRGSPMLSNSIRAVTLVTAFAACAVSFASTAHAAPFDGSWSVLIVTRSGACDPSFRTSVFITNGIVTAGGGASISGRVSNNGAVNVVVSGGPGTAHGTGRLSRNGAGGGSWRGSGGQGSCSGSWSASRGG